MWGKPLCSAVGTGHVSEMYNITEVTIQMHSCKQSMQCLSVVEVGNIFCRQNAMAMAASVIGLSCFITAGSHYGSEYLCWTFPSRVGGTLPCSCTVQDTKNSCTVTQCCMVQHLISLCVFLYFCGRKMVSRKLASGVRSINCITDWLFVYISLHCTLLKIAKLPFLC